MIDYSASNLLTVSVHNIGNKTNGDDLHLSHTPLNTSDFRVRDLLFKYFLTPFVNPEFYAFTSTNGDFHLNPLYIFASQIFENIKASHFNSINIAKHLFEVSVHPQIKPGDLFVAYFSKLFIENETIDAIGIFKSEHRQAFLKLDSTEDGFIIQYDDGINVEKLDKGCLILNTGKDSGYKICIIDKTSKSTEAQYWKDDFLRVSPLKDEYHQTSQFLGITKDFVTKQISEEFEMNKAGKIDLLNRSVGYFKSHENFDKEEFENEVFQDTGIIKSFRNFDSSFRKENEIEVADNFEISPQAVKKQARVFKSILKLDKNFHIYIHGNRELIEQGTDPDGRKFYKIYYKEEN